MPHSLKSTLAIMFADDRTIYKTHNDLRELFQRINSDLTLLGEWYQANKLVINATKTKYIVI